MGRTMKTLRFSDTVLQDIQPWIEKNNLNFTSFVMEPVKNYIQVLKYREGVNQSFGAWKDHEHPELKKGSTPYVRKMRKGRVHGTF